MRSILDPPLIMVSKLTHVFLQALDIWMSTNVIFVFLAMLEFAIVNTLARNEIRMMSINAREVQKDTSLDLVSHNVHMLCKSTQ